MDIMIQTPLGKMIGNQKTGFQEFLGIRFAKPPIGNLRYSPPVPVESWDDIYNATEYGPIAPQGFDDDPPIHMKESEDCLVLNIYTPKADNEKRPVMVFIHGGAFLIDSASRPRHHGGNLAIQGKVVVVTIEYRMGMLGFLNLPGISPNLGLQDQICALSWIRDNIAVFGGNSSNVTIFGESAGSLSVSYLMVISQAQGLFHKAIAQSGALDLREPWPHLKDLKKSEQSTLKFLKLLHIQAEDIQTLRQLPLEVLIAAERKMTKNKFLTDQIFYPFGDGVIISTNLSEAWKKGHARSIPLLIGTNTDELPIFGGGFIKSKIQQLLIQNLIKRGIVKETGISAANFNRIQEIYRKRLDHSAIAMKKDFDAIFTDITFRIRAIKQAELHCSIQPKTFCYLLNYQAPKIHAAVHVLDLLFIFGHVESTDIGVSMQLSNTENERNLSNQMMKAWTNFAHFGDPNHSDLPQWPPYNQQQRATMIFDVPCKIENAPKEEERRAWESAFH